MASGLAMEEIDIGKEIGLMKKYVLDNMETLSLKRIRRLIEEKHRLSTGALDKRKDVVTSHVDEIIQKFQDQKTKGGDGKDHSAKVESNTNKMNSKLSLSASKMIDILRKVGVTYSHLFKNCGNDNHLLEERLTKALSRVGLSIKSNNAEIKAVKKKLTQEKELDGIDLRNVVHTKAKRRNDNVKREKGIKESSHIITASATAQKAVHSRIVEKGTNIGNGMAKGSVIPPENNNKRKLVLEESEDEI